jgi:DNA-binding protein HU-beta
VIEKDFFLLIVNTHVDRNFFLHYFKAMNKTELVDRLAEQTRLTKMDIEQVINKTIEIIKTAVKSGDDVTLVGFGTFTRTIRQARMGRNPQTGKEMQIPSSVVPKFRAGKEFRKALEQK